MRQVGRGENSVAQQGFVAEPVSAVVAIYHFSIKFRLPSRLAHIIYR
jgi:hypothetical protein